MLFSMAIFPFSMFSYSRAINVNILSSFALPKLHNKQICNSNVTLSPTHQFCEILQVYNESASQCAFCAKDIVGLVWPCPSSFKPCMYASCMDGYYQ